jgi:hypothetical protein
MNIREMSDVVPGLLCDPCRKGFAERHVIAGWTIAEQDNNRDRQPRPTLAAGPSARR